MAFEEKKDPVSSECLAARLDSDALDKVTGGASKNRQKTEIEIDEEELWKIEENSGHRAE